MATAKRARPSRLSVILRVLSIVAILGILVWYFFGAAIAGFGEAGTGYAAKTTCSCRYLGGRDLASCGADLPSNMWAIWVSEDESAQNVTARVPLVSSDTATYRAGYGCVLDPRG